MKLLVYEMEQNRPRVGDEGSKLFDSRTVLNYNSRRNQTAIFPWPQMYSASGKFSKFSGCIMGRCEYNYLFCVGAAYVNAQKKPIPLNAGFRVVVDDLDLCYHNEYWIMASRTALRAIETLLIISNKVSLYNYSVPPVPAQVQNFKAEQTGCCNL